MKTSIGVLSIILAACTGIAPAWISAAEYDAAAIAEQEFAGIRASVCPQPEGTPPGPGLEVMFDTALQRMEPVRVFDNLYFVGMKTVSAWALTTTEGIILFEAMLHHNVEDTIIAGMRRLGLDPRYIRYVIISHGHNDHFGGARYLQQTYGARIFMSEQDWEHMRSWPQIGSPAPFPDQDVAVHDGDVIKLGNVEVTIHVTPGHTPGTISPVFPVKDGDRTHLAAYWGGGSFSFLDPAGIETYIRSTETHAAMRDNIEVELSNHAYADGTLLKLVALSARRPGDPHPFVTGKDHFRAWMGVYRDCARQTLETKRAAAAE